MSPKSAANLATNDSFRRRYNIPFVEEREIALNQLKRICFVKFFSVADVQTNPHIIYVVHEIARLKNLEQLNLFGGTVSKLGTEKLHERFLDVTVSLRRYAYDTVRYVLHSIECFGLTDLG
ncbi:acyl-Coenzyme A oxidase [Aphanomyces cochlioides]|nr:acyl-Coenzyme A oxidase [Aphanomyces cochlioides]